MLEVTEKDLLALVAKHSNWLTEAEVREVAATAHIMWLDIVTTRVAEVAYQVEIFSTPRHEWDLPKLGYWLQIGLEFLMDGDQLQSLKIPTRESLVETFGAKYQEVLKDHQEYLAENPIGYRECYPHNAKLQEHPWGDKLVKLCHLWLQTSPYKVWKIYKDCWDSALEILAEDLTEIAAEPHSGIETGRRIGNLVHGSFANEIKAFRRENQ